MTATELRGRVLQGSCVNICGGQVADGSCWCDDACTEYGNCCADYEEACLPKQLDPIDEEGEDEDDGLVIQSATCDGFCGKVNRGARCWCDDLCAENNDCCQDYEAVCLPVPFNPADDP